MNIIQEMGKSFLIIEDRTYKESAYKSRMLTDNHVPGLLTCKKGLYQNEEVLKYDVTNMKSLRSEYENRMMNFNDIAELIYGIATIVTGAASYLLDEGYFCYQPDAIYSDMEYDRLYMLYIPFMCNENDKEGIYRELAEYILEKLDHKDESAVSIAYQFYRMSKEPLFSIQGFCSLIDHEKNTRASEIKEGQKKENGETNRYLPGEQDLPKAVSTIYGRTGFDTADIRSSADRKIPIISGIITIAVGLIYGLFGQKSLYGVYMIMALLITATITVILSVRYIVSIIQSKKENGLIKDMPDNPVTVNEYWGGDEKTVFFDEETQFFDDTGNEEIALEWSENGKEKRERIKKDTAYIGKKYEEVDVCISDPTISRKHARISISGNQITLQDLGSTNGTYIEGRRIDPGEEIRLLKNQDFVLGKVAVRVV